MTLICRGDHGADICTIYYRAYGEHINAYDDSRDAGLVLPPDSGRIIIGINSPASRHQIAQRFENLRGAKPLIDPTAIVGPRSSLGLGSVVAPGAILLHDVTLGKHVHVNYQTSMTRCVVADFTTISPGVTICGNVEIGQECWIGAGAVIADRVAIGDNVLVAAGAIIPPESVIPDNTKVIGVWKQ